MRAWCVYVTGLSGPCYECSGGSDADVYFVAAETRSDAMDLVQEHRTSWARKQNHVWELEVEEARRLDDYRAFPVREWRGKTRMLREAEVEL